MSYIKYQRPCFKKPQQIELNVADVRRTVPFNKLSDPLEYKYQCWQPQTYSPPQIEGFDFNNDLWDYNPSKCMYSANGVYICAQK